MEVSDKKPLVRFVLVEPMYKGNIGSVARVMKNFGFTDLALVNPCKIGDETWAMASHARDVIENAKVCEDIEDAIKDCDVIIGTTGAKAYRKCDHIRTPALTPEEIVEKIDTFKDYNRVAILFGREDHGFKNEELKLCTIIATIPTSDIYPVINLSHAVGVIAYELSNIYINNEEINNETEPEKRNQKNYKNQKYEIVDRTNFEHLCMHVREILEESDYTESKIDRTELMFRRIFGRANLTLCEAKTIRGIIRHLQYHVKKSKGINVSKEKVEIANIFEDDLEI